MKICISLAATVLLAIQIAEGELALVKITNPDPNISALTKPSLDLNLGGILNGVNNVLEPVSEASSEVSSLASDVGSGASTLVAGLSEAANQVVSSDLTNLDDTAPAIFEAMIEVIQPTLNSAFEAGLNDDLAPKLVQNVQQVEGTVTEEERNVLDAVLGDGLPNVVSDLSNVVPSILPQSDISVPNLDNVLAPVSGVANEASSLVSDVVPGEVPIDFLNAVQPVVDAAKVDGLVPGLVQDVQQVVSTVTDGVENILSSVSGVANGVSNVVSSVENLVPELSNAPCTCGSSLSSIPNIGATVDQLTNTASEIANEASNVVSGISDAVSDVTDSVPEAVDGVTNGVQNVADTLSNAVDGVLGEVSNVANGVSNIVDGVINVVDRVTNDVHNVADTVSNTADGVLEGVSNVADGASNAVNGVTNIVSEIPNLAGTVSFLLQTPEIKDLVTALVTKIVQVVLEGVV